MEVVVSGLSWCLGRPARRRSSPRANNRLRLASRSQLQHLRSNAGNAQSGHGQLAQLDKGREGRAVRPATSVDA